MKTPISYYGGKQNMAKHILPLIPKHIQYVEPFMGGGAIFWAKPKSQHEVINDFDNRVMNFWTVLRDDFEALQYKIQGTLHSEYMYRQVQDMLRAGYEKTDRVSFAWAFWVKANMGFASSTRITVGFAFGNTSSCSRKTTAKRESFFEDFYLRIKDVEIFNRDAINLIKLKDDQDTFFYFDSPYPESDCDPYKDQKMVYYRLLEILPTIKAKWLMSSYPSEQLTQLRKDHGWKYKDTKQALAVSGKHNAGKFKTECLTYNYQPEGQTLDMFNS